MQHRPSLYQLLSGLFFFCLFFGFSYECTAQLTPELGIDDNELLNPTCETFCRPGLPFKSRGKGVELRYEVQGGHKFGVKGGDSGDGGISQVATYSHFVAKFKIPVINAPSVKFLLGYEYVNDRFDFDAIDGGQSELFRELDGRALKMNKFSAYFTKAWNDRIYTVARLRVATRGDYEGWSDFSSPNMTYSGALILGKKPDEQTEWGVGITFSHNDLRTQILPFAVYNKNFSDKWGIETVLPVQVFGRYNVKPGCIALFGARLNTHNHFLSWQGANQREELTPYFLRQANVRIEAIVEKQLHGWIWAYATTGMVVPISNNFRSANENIPQIDLQSGVRPMFRIGLFLSPPDSMVK